MFDDLYADIGEKIKNWAKWIFTIEAIAFIIAGFCFICSEDSTENGYMGYGLLMMILGPVVAWVSSWLLYAFGQLVDDIHAMRNKEGTTEEVRAKRESEYYAQQEALAQAKMQRTAADQAKQEALERAHQQRVAAMQALDATNRNNSKQVPNDQYTGGKFCELCGKNTDDLYRRKINNTVGWADICAECAKKI